MNETMNKADRSRRILIVDDSEDITKMLEILLRKVGYDVVAVSSAMQALEVAQGEQFNLVIADIGMPGLSGYDLAAQLRALPEYNDVPMIAITGFAEYHDKQQVLHAGFNEYLKKPFDPQTLVEIIERNLSNEEQSKSHS